MRRRARAVARANASTLKRSEAGERERVNASAHVIDEKFMARALRLARRGVALASPNPMVGAVVVRGGRVVGEGFHSYAEKKHAEGGGVGARGGESAGRDAVCEFGAVLPCGEDGAVFAGGDCGGSEAGGGGDAGPES